MKIIINKSEVSELQNTIDIMLKAGGIQVFQLATKMLNSIEVVPEEGKPEETENKKVLE